MISLDENLRTIKRILRTIIIVCTVFEVLFFPSIANAVGCVVTLVSLWLFNNYILKTSVMQECPFSFIAFLQLFLFMFLALPCTLLDGNEMSHDLYNPISTYLWQLLYFAISTLAFLMARRFSRRHRGVQNMLGKIGFFNTPSMQQLWLLAAIGWIPKMLLLNSQYSGEEMYQSGAGTLSMFSVFIYAPVVALFMPLLGGYEISKAAKKLVYGYAIFLSIMMIATNSRSQMVAVWFVVVFGFMIKYFYKEGTQSLMKPKRIFIYLVAFLVVTGPVSDMAFAMLLARSDRSQLSFTGLLSRTWEIYSDRDYMAKMKAIADMESNDQLVNSYDWNESYVSNIFLQRVTNYRVVDATIYHAQKAGFANAAMWDDFCNHVEYVFPEPLIKLFDPSFKKNLYSYSAMDKLYSESRGEGLVPGFKVGGDVGLGLAIFGYFYFPLTFIVYFVLFYIFNNMVRIRNGSKVFPLFILMMVYDYVFRRFDVAQGITKHISWIIYGSYMSIIILQLVINIAYRIFPGKERKVALCND